MTPKTMITDLTELAVSEDDASPTECQPTYVEGPAIEDAGSWGQRFKRLLRRLDQADGGTPLAAQSAWAVVQGLQRARAMADELGNRCSLDSEGGCGADALMAVGEGVAEESAGDGMGEGTAHKVERLAKAEKWEV